MKQRTVSIILWVLAAALSARFMFTVTGHGLSGWALTAIAASTLLANQMSLLLFLRFVDKVVNGNRQKPAATE